MTPPSDLAFLSSNGSSYLTGLSVRHAGGTVRVAFQFTGIVQSVMLWLTACTDLLVV